MRTEWMGQGKKISELEEKTIEINHLKIRQKISRKKKPSRTCMTITKI